MILTICTVLPRAYVLAGNNELVKSSSEYSGEELTEMCPDISGVEAISLCAGPGSYTGIRIGFSYAEGLARARGLRVFSSTVFDVARSAFAGPEDELLFYANRHELFRDGEKIEVVSEPHSLGPYELVVRGREEKVVSLEDDENLLRFMLALREQRGKLGATYVKPFRAG